MLSRIGAGQKERFDFVSRFNSSCKANAKDCRLYSIVDEKRTFEIFDGALYFLKWRGFGFFIKTALLLVIGRLSKNTSQPLMLRTGINAFMPEKTSSEGRFGKPCNIKHGQRRREVCFRAVRPGSARGRPSPQLENGRLIRSLLKAWVNKKQKRKTLCELPLEKVQVSTKDQLCPEAHSDRGISLSSSTRAFCQPKVTKRFQ